MASTQDQQQLALFIKESKVIASQNLNEFNAMLQTAIGNGWMQYGQPFPYGNYLAVNVVKVDERITTFIQKAVDIGLSQLAELGM